jgi:SAM-dependent methyltransferase
VYATDVNSPISKFTARLLNTYLRFPDNKPVTAFDVRCGNGETLNEITRNAYEAHKYGIESNDYLARQASEKFQRVCKTDYKSQAKITNDVFSLAVVNPIIDQRIQDEMLSDFDYFKDPDFEAEERARILALEATKDQLDLNLEDLTEEEKAKQQEEVEKKIQKAVQERKIAYLRVLREQEKRTETYRDDKFLLSMVTKYLAPRGILIFITPKELIDGQICFKLANNYEDIRIIRQEDDEYEKQRKCIIIARKRMRVIRDEETAAELMKTKRKSYKDIPTIEPQLEPLYDVPSKSAEDILNFRVGPITADEALQMMNRSPVINNYIKTYGMIFENEMPEPPTQLHKGHVSLLLASGLLNGYIGTGPNQHLVKGSVIKMSEERLEEDPETEETKTVEREYFHIGIKYLDRYGQFHKLL